MTFTVEVERHSGAYFEPYVEDHDNGCIIHFHNDDITEDGAWYFAQACTGQAIRWAPRASRERRGQRIPIAMERRRVMPDDTALIVDDRPNSIKYTVRAELITARGGNSLCRTLSDRSPDWGRLPAPHTARLKAV